MMTIKDRWGTQYPDSMQAYVNPGSIINLDADVKDLADSIVASSETTDDAILKIHSFIKDLNVGKIPVIIDIPALIATDQVKALYRDPSRKNYSHNKAILEVALLRALDIPSRPATFACDVSPIATSRNISGVPPIGIHHATEVYTRDIDGQWKFKLKESWVPSRDCGRFKGTCMNDERDEWLKNREIKGIQRVMKCAKIIDHVDYPGILSLAVNAGIIARQSSRLVDAIDPVED
jgi:hypothetical protein